MRGWGLGTKICLYLLSLLMLNVSTAIINMLWIISLLICSISHQHRLTEKLDNCILNIEMEHCINHAGHIIWTQERPPLHCIWSSSLSKTSRREKCISSQFSPSGVPGSASTCGPRVGGCDALAIPLIPRPGMRPGTHPHRELSS